MTKVVSAVLLFAITASAQEATELVRMLQHRPDARGRGRLVRTDADRQQHVHPVTVVRKILPQSAYVLLSVEEGPRILVEEPFAGPLRIWIDSSNPIPQRRWTDAVARTDFTLEDIAEAHFYWSRQTVIRKEPCGMHECVVLRSQPEERTPTAYAEVQSWVDRTALLAVRTVKMRKDGGPAKEIVARGLRQAGTQWAASTVEARTHGEAAFTRLVITSGSEKAHVNQAEVDPQVLFAGK